MKRLFPLLLVLLLLAGCGKDETQTTAPTTAAQTEPAGLHISGHEIETATGGAVRAYGITGSAVYAVTDGVAVLDEAGGLTVLDLEEGKLIDSASHITNVLEVYGSSIYYEKNEVYCYDYITDKTESWALPKDMLGAFAIGTQTREIYYCLSGGVYALDMQTGLSRMLRQHSYEQQSVIGAYFGGSVIGWKTEAGVSYLSTADGTELCREQGIYEMYTQGERYFALRLDGMVEQVITGTRGGEASLIGLPKDGLVPVLSMDGLLQIGEGISYYDLTTGLRSAAVTLPKEQTVLSVADGNGYIWLLTEAALYRWDVSGSAVSDETVYTGMLYTAQNPDPEGMAQCESRVSQMNKDLGVRIRIGQDAVAQPGDNQLTVEYQPEAINYMLDALEPLLMRFPKNFLKKTVDGGWVRICLVRSVDNEVDHARYWVDGDCYIAIGLTADMTEAFLTGLGGAVDSHILGNSRDLEYWDEMNPEGFQYLYGEQAPEDHAQYVGTYFADEISMTYPSEDRARILYHAMTDGNEAMFQESALQAKLLTLCEGIREAYGLKKNTEVLPWEQYLETSLAYKK